MKKAIFCTLALAVSAYASERHYFSIIGKTGDDYLIMPGVSPVVSVNQMAGDPLPETGAVNCKWKQEKMKTPAGDNINILAGYCENGVVLHVTGIDLNH